MPPSGQQFEISSGAHRATIVEVGGGIRSYTVDGQHVLNPYRLEDMCDGAHGAPLIPWPNRLADGRYTFDGIEYQVALTEPKKNNAIHGFLRWRSWQPIEHTADRIVMTTRLHPLDGYPFTLDVRIAYSIDEDGLTATTAATNLGPEACPYASGQHPYLSPGDGLIDDCTLEFRADTRIDTDDERQLPTGKEPVAGSEYDFSTARPLGNLKIDYAFTDLERGSDGRAWVRLQPNEGPCRAFWVDESYPYIELYTGDTLNPERRRRGLGCEPMTGPPNAFRSGEDLIRLEPGEGHTAQWGVRVEA